MFAPTKGQVSSEDQVLENSKQHRNFAGIVGMMSGIQMNVFPELSGEQRYAGMQNRIRTSNGAMQKFCCTAGLCSV